MEKAITSIIFLIFTIVSNYAFADTKYCTYLNNFEGFNAQINNNRMIVSNDSLGIKHVLNSFSFVPYKFKIVARIANLNNNENKTYIVSGKGKIKYPVWGITFNYIDENNYCAVILSCTNSALHDITDKRKLHLKLIRITNSICETIDSVTITKDANLHTGDNLISIEYNQRETIISLGRKKLIERIRTDKINYTQELRTGIYCGEGSNISTERFVIKYLKDESSSLITNWNIEKLRHHFKNSIDPYEGFWKYYDREMEEDKVRLGGRYTLALVKTNQGYDVLYIDGAKVAKSKWKQCMLKAKLLTGAFIDDFDLIWYDSNFLPLDVDVSAYFENASILTFKFPIQDSQIRFHKVINSSDTEIRLD